MWTSFAFVRSSAWLATAMTLASCLAPRPTGRGDPGGGGDLDAGPSVDAATTGLDAASSLPDAAPTGPGAAPGSRFGINVHRPTGPALAAQLDRVVEGGLDWIRIDVDWYVVEPAQNQFQWATFDAIVEGATARGLHIFASLGFAPAWSNGGRPPKVPPTNVADWVDFCTRVAQRYDGVTKPRIDHFGMWNEPDHGGRKFFGEDDATHDEVVDLYVERILEPGYAAIHAARDGVSVLAPDLAYRPEFLVDILARAQDSIDIITVHQYGDQPSDVTDYLDGTHWPWEDPSIEAVLDDAGVLGAKPVWLTETGWPTPGPHECWFDPVSEPAQAQRLTALLDDLAERTWIDKVFVYELADANLVGACQWGLLRNDLSPKPAFGALRDYIAASP